jgi:hypothetical protein
MAKVTPAVQQQFHLLNNIVTGTNPPHGVNEVVNLWYSGNNPASFDFTRGAAQLPNQPFIHQPGNIHHEPLYDSVVKSVCRTCHVALELREWDSFDQMIGRITPQHPEGETAFSIRSLACAPKLAMPHVQVPWVRFWQQNLSATLASELAFPPPGCPPS